MGVRGSNPDQMSGLEAQEDFLVFRHRLADCCAIPSIDNVYASDDL